MSQCLNQDCLHLNAPHAKLCQKCGHKLLLADRYRATKYLGEGGFWRGFTAIDEHQIDTAYVIKQLYAPQKGNGELEPAIEILKQEIKQLLNLSEYGQLPDLLAFLEQEGCWYLVQQWSDGQDLLTEWQLDSLDSDMAIDYTSLRDLLAAGKWKEADRATRLLVLKAANCEQKGFLNADDWLKFPATDLGTIDQLWLKYSDGNFGFSVQKRIWENIGGKSNPDWDTICRFADAVGWRRGKDWLYEQDLIFHPHQAVPGHLPSDALCHYSAPTGSQRRRFGLVGCRLAASLFSRPDLPS